MSFTIQENHRSHRQDLSQKPIRSTSCCPPLVPTIALLYQQLMPLTSKITPHLLPSSSMSKYKIISQLPIYTSSRLQGPPPTNSTPCHNLEIRSMTKDLSSIHALQPGTVSPFSQISHISLFIHSLFSLFIHVYLFILPPNLMRYWKPAGKTISGSVCQ